MKPINPWLSTEHAKNENKFSSEALARAWMMLVLMIYSGSPVFAKKSYE